MNLNFEEVIKKKFLSFRNLLRLSKYKKKKFKKSKTSINKFKVSLTSFPSIMNGKSCVEKLKEQRKPASKSKKS